MSLLMGWGRYPSLEGDAFAAPSPQALQAILQKQSFSGIARGMGRSYGDSSLAPHVLSTRYLNHFLSFNTQTGELSCEAGVLLQDIVSTFITKGWFLPVTPGTQFVSVGGAIASDVHGKNHHGVGCFSAHVKKLTLLLGDGQTLTCSPQEHADLFHATCGGMGLTGVILEATFYLKKIASATMRQTTYQAGSLSQIMALLQEQASASYSVAWIDCLARGTKLGRSVLFTGEHNENVTPSVKTPKKITIPCDFPSQLLNRYTLQAFNALYYHKPRKYQTTVSIDSFFYPLDHILHWNRLYGKAGFLQYQAVIPFEAGEKGLTQLLKTISDAGQGSFLAVLKLLGPANKNLLSFPMEGYTLALDFKYSATVLELLNRLDNLVLDLNGRVYLTKDARLSETTFKCMYPRWEEFMHIRHRYHADLFYSEQSKRLGLVSHV